MQNNKNKFVFNDKHLHNIKSKFEEKTGVQLIKPKKIQRQNWIKPVLKFALPAMMAFGMVCLMIIGNMPTEINSGNWFTLVAYAGENSIFEIKDTKVLLPAGTWKISKDPNIGSSWRAASDGEGNIIPGGFKIEGENIKSVNFKSENGSFRDSLFIRNASDEELQARYAENGSYNINPVYLEGDDILNAKYFAWSPDRLMGTKMSGNYQDYLTDIITITVIFDDGGMMTQIVKITIDEETGEMFAQIIK